MTELELLYDHYKETTSLVADLRAVRNKTFLAVLICLLALAVLNPRADELLQAISTGILSFAATERIESPVAIMSGVAFNALLWTVLCLSLVHYYRMSSHTHRLYVYLALLENRMNAILGKVTIAREGAYYYGALESGNGLRCFLHGCADSSSCTTCCCNLAFEREGKFLCSTVAKNEKEKFHARSGGIRLVNSLFRFAVPSVGSLICLYRIWEEWSGLPWDGSPVAVVGFGIDALLCLFALGILIIGGGLRGWEL